MKINTVLRYFAVAILAGMFAGLAHAQGPVYWTNTNGSSPVDVSSATDESPTGIDSASIIAELTLPTSQAYMVYGKTDANINTSGTRASFGCYLEYFDTTFRKIDTYANAVQVVSSVDEQENIFLLGPTIWLPATESGTITLYFSCFPTSPYAPSTLTFFNTQISAFPVTSTNPIVE
jgi:hypothetical protein